LILTAGDRDIVTSIDAVGVNEGVKGAL